MAVTIDFCVTDVISVPKSDLTLISGTLYELDSEWLWHQIRLLEQSEAGRPCPQVIRHSTEKTVAGLTYARFLEILPPYTLTIEDGSYGVIVTGSNNNFHDDLILNRNSVSVTPQNSAGLIKGGLGVVVEGTYTAADLMKLMLAVMAGKSTITPVSAGVADVAFRDAADTKDRVVVRVTDSERAVPTTLDGS